MDAETTPVLGKDFDSETTFDFTPGSPDVKLFEMVYRRLRLFSSQCWADGRPAVEVLIRSDSDNFMPVREDWEYDPFHFGWSPDGSGPISSRCLGVAEPMDPDCVEFDIVRIAILAYDETGTCLPIEVIRLYQDDLRTPEARTSVWIPIKARIDELRNNSHIRVTDTVFLGVPASFAA